MPIFKGFLSEIFWQQLKLASFCTVCKYKNSFRNATAPKNMGTKGSSFASYSKNMASSETRVGWKSGKKLSRPLVYPRREGGGGK